MSRAVRKQIFKKLEELCSENQKIITDVIAEAQLQDTFARCQNMAVDIGTQIETVYGEGFDCVHGLEDYCELIYMTAVEQDMKKREDLEKRAEKILQNVIQYTQKEIPDKLEAVFLPYKASMWDSLESIWLAAREDETCDAYVIPIPYYDKKADGTLGEEHYEGGEYPDYILVTGYDSYDFEARRPDIVFIHNPYDGGNHVTSVHPFFYSKNLKRYTEKLVYVPYFVLEGNGIPENYALTTGVIYADYVVVQNETEKDDYIRYFKKAAPDFPIEDKLLPLGLPKFDKVRALNRENVDAPQEWRERSKGKKVILYNTSLNAMLENGAAYIEKLKDVFTFFKGSKEAVLLWRPHPLMESSIASMRPELYEAYITLKKWFLEEKIGIYDDTPDMYTAIGFSDAYYGDLSSVVWLYRQTGKPVLIQKAEALEEK